MRMIVTAEGGAKVYGKHLSKGDEFHCSKKEAVLWEGLARASSYSTKQMMPDNQKSNAAAEQQNSSPRRRGRPPGSYNRSDMRAED